MKLKHIPIIKFQNCRVVLMFFIGMAAMSLLSRAADSFLVPQVTTASPESMKLEYPTEIEGRISATESRAIYCIENLRVAHVEIKPNDMVKEGDLLFSIDKTDLEEKIQQAEQESQKLSIQINDLEQTRQAQASQHIMALRRAKEDYQDISNSSNAAVDAACRELEQAKDALSLHDSQKPQESITLEDTGTDAPEQGAPETSGASTAPMAEEENPLNAWLQKREELAQACLEKEKQYEEAVAASKESLKTAARQLEDASLPEAADSSSSLLQLDQSNAARTLQELKALSKAGGNVYSKYNGQVLSCNISIGSATSGEPAVLLADFSQPLQFEGILEGSGEFPIEEGATGTLTAAGHASVLEGVAVTGISQEPDGTCQVTAALDAYGDITPGAAILDVTKKSQRYPCCIPLSALYSGEHGDFAIKVTEKPTILGLQATAEYVPITILEKNSAYAAVEGNLSSSDRIITNASKTIKEGERIRITEH